MNAMLAILGLGTGEMIVVVVVILVLFGAKRIPEFAKGLGKGINEFKKASRDVVDSIEEEQKHSPTTPVVTKTPPVNTTAQTQTPPPETKVV